VIYLWFKAFYSMPLKAAGGNVTKPVPMQEERGFFPSAEVGGIE